MDHSISTQAVKTHALNQLKVGTSILIPFATLAIKLPGWSREDKPVRNDLQRESEDMGNAAEPGIGDNDIDADDRLLGTVNMTEVTFDVCDMLTDAMQNRISDVQSHTSSSPVSEPGRYYGDIGDELQADNDIIIPDDYDDIDSLADLEPLSPQSWEFDEEDRV